MLKNYNKVSLGKIIRVKRDKDTLIYKQMIPKITIAIKVVTLKYKLEYATAQSSGMDLRAYLPDGEVVLHPGERKLIPTGIYVQLPENFEMQIRPRSGLALKHGITVLNAPGTVDADYRGEIGVVLINFGNEDFVINDGERIAQGVLSQFVKVVPIYTDKLDESERGNGGFGHTGVK